MDTYSLAHLPTEQLVVFVTATAGQVIHTSCNSVRAKDIFQAFVPSIASLAHMQTVIALVQGEVPDNMKRLWRLLLRKSLPADALRGVHVAVFGLGDSGMQPL